MSVTESLTTDDAQRIDEMFGQSNSVNVVDLLSTIMFARAAALRAVNLYDANAIFLEAQAALLRRTAHQLAEIIATTTPFA